MREAEKDLRRRQKEIDTEMRDIWRRQREMDAELRKLSDMEGAERT